MALFIQVLKKYTLKKENNYNSMYGVLQYIWSGNNRSGKRIGYTYYWQLEKIEDFFSV